MKKRSGDDEPTRRRFLTVATCGLGSTSALIVAGPALALIADPIAKRTVRTPTEPLDLGDLESLSITEVPRRIEVVAPRVTDAWTAASNVLLGAAWIRRTAGSLEAFSAVCPHLGCAIASTGAEFRCPCHDSRFAVTGARLTGPSERGLDPLPVQVVEGRLQLTWLRFRPGGATRELT